MLIQLNDHYSSLYVQLATSNSINAHIFCGNWYTSKRLLACDNGQILVDVKEGVIIVSDQFQSILLYINVQ